MLGGVLTVRIDTESVSRCGYHKCVELSDGWYLLAPGVDVPVYGVVEDGNFDQPIPLCQWHALLVGDRRVAGWIPSIRALP
jgi:hypothetical protein